MATSSPSTAARPLRGAFHCGLHNKLLPHTDMNVTCHTRRGCALERRASVAAGDARRVSGHVPTMAHNKNTDATSSAPCRAPPYCWRYPTSDKCGRPTRNAPKTQHNATKRKKRRLHVARQWGRFRRRARKSLSRLPLVAATHRPSSPAATHRGTFSIAIARRSSSPLPAMSPAVARGLCCFSLAAGHRHIPPRNVRRRRRSSPAILGGHRR